MGQLNPWTALRCTPVCSVLGSLMLAAVGRRGVCVCVCVCSECDQVIFSGGETSGTVTSPYYPRAYPRDVRCIYYIDGLHDKQNLEKVQLTVTDVDIPTTAAARRAGGSQHRSLTHTRTHAHRL